MGMFDKFKTENDGVTQEADRLGGFSLKDTGIYDGVLKLLYFGEYGSGARYAEAHIDIDGHVHRERINFTNKAGENFYKDKTTGKPRFLPGFEVLNDLAVVTTGKDLVDLESEIEEKTIKLYDYDAKKEVPQNVPCLVPAMGQPVTVALFRQIVDKQAKDTSGNYANTGETREENVVDKFFHTETRMTAHEAKSGMSEGVFIEKWDEKNSGNAPRNLAKGAASGGAPGRPGAPSAASTGGAQKSSSGLFGG